jgi:predicted ATPase
VAREFVEAAEQHDETYYRMVGYRMLAMIQIAMGQNREGLKNLQRRHYTEAGLADPAVRYWLAAGELALSRSAYAEADRYVNAATFSSVGCRAAMYGVE